MIRPAMLERNRATASTQTLGHAKGLEHFSMRRRRAEVALSPSEIKFADAYLDLANAEAHDWAADILSTVNTAEEKLNLIMSVIQRAHLPDDEEALGSLGAGPMEDLMSDWLLDRLKDYLPFSQELRCCLSMVRMEFEPPALHERLLRLRGVH